MASDDSTGGAPRGQTRVPIDAEVQLEFENFSGFIREVSANLSLGGLFVKTRYLKPVGTIVRFEFRLSDQYRLIRGSGEVVWTRWRDQPPAMPAGMGIQFLELDAESRSLVTAIVEQHERAGGSPFDLESQAQLEAASPRSEASPFAVPPPAARGAGVSSAEVSEWLRGETGNAPESSGVEAWQAETEGPRALARQTEIFTPPAPEAAAPALDTPVFELPAESPPELEVDFARLPELPAVPEAPALPSPDDTNSWGLTPRENTGQSRALDWGAAEAMAALGIATSTPVAPAAFEVGALRERAEVPAPPAAHRPPPPRFGGGQAARAEEESRPLLWVVASVAVVAIALGGWWILRGRQSAPRTPPNPSAPQTAAPAVVPPPKSADAPSPAAAVPGPSAAAATSGAPGAAPEALSPAPSTSAPAVTPPAPAPVTAATPAASPAPTVEVAPPVARAPRFTSVMTITWQARGGETEVAIATNGSVGAADIESTRLEKPEPRELIKIKGVRQAFNPTKLEAKTPELRQIRIGFHEDGAQGQLHIVLDLASPDVRVLSVRAEGVVVRVRLGKS